METIINETISDKMTKIWKVLQSQSIQKDFIRLDLTYDLIKIENTDTIKLHGISKINTDADYYSKQGYISISFPIYELLKKMQSGKLFGVNLEAKDISLLIYLYQYLFENIDMKNSYRLIDKPLHKEVKNNDKKNTIIESIQTYDSLTLIKAFLFVTNKINTIIDELSFINNLSDEKIELENIEEVIESIEKQKVIPLQIDFEHSSDVMKERKSVKILDTESLNKNLNEKVDKNSTRVIQTENVSNSNRISYKRKGSYKQKKTSFITSSLVTASFLPKFETSMITLDPTDDSFDKIFTKEEMLYHKLINARSGVGKSEYTKVLALKDIQDVNTSFILIDGGQKLALELAKLVDPERLVFLDQSLDSGYNFSFNPIDPDDKSEKNISIMSKHIAKSFE
ncbi:MAG: hypothetical protein KAJ49_09060, partial [Arcobacteraceae bacterium]|nr:hypothetical protein [Arcobacteraceae bacterium]